MATEGYSGADIELLCREAAMKPVRRLMERLRNVPDEQLPGHPRGTAMHAARGGISRTGSGGAVDVNASIDAMLKADVVSSEDCMEALQTTKPASSTSQHERWDYFQLQYDCCDQNLMIPFSFC